MSEAVENATERLHALIGDLQQDLSRADTRDLHVRLSGRIASARQVLAIITADS